MWMLFFLAYSVTDEIMNVIAGCQNFLPVSIPQKYLGTLRSTVDSQKHSFSDL